MHVFTISNHIHVHVHVPKTMIRSLNTLSRSSTRAHLLLLQLRVQLLVVDAGAAVSQLLLLGLLEPRVQLVVEHVIGLAARTRRQQSLGAQRQLLLQ